jgi:uncharacterized protein with von Willebrand factor type A (vWA) domain
VHPPADPMRALVEFVAVVRRHGVPAGPDRVHACAAALDALCAAGVRDPLYWAGRLTLCADAAQLSRYAEAWRAYATQAAGGVGATARRPGSGRHRTVTTFGLDADTAATADDAGQRLPVAMRASSNELLRHRDLAELSTVEREEVHRLLAVLRPVAPARPARRHRPAPRGGVDTRRSLRSSLRTLGEPALLAHRRRRERPRRLVLLIDVSGSMAPYADGLLRFAHAAVRLRPAATEVFTLGTRLTRVTGQLRMRDPDAALAAAGAAIPDWSGGTRLGDGLAAFVTRYAHPGLARRAVVVVFSDGWERGDPARLAEAAARLRRLVHRMIWVTPHAGRPGFEPTAGGLAAVLPRLDALVAGHSVAALTELVDTIRDGG